MATQVSLNSGAVASAGSLKLQTNGTTDAVTIDTSQNVGIGTSSPNKGGVSRALSLNGTAGNIVEFCVSDTRTGWVYGDNNLTALAAAGSRYISLETNGSERARIDSSGNLLVGTTAAWNFPSSNATGAGINPSSYIFCTRDGAVSLFLKRLNSSGPITEFWYGTSIVGTISVTASSTAYNTSSDYRLKENVQPMQNALATVAQLKPVTYTWKADGSAGQGFIAHELQEVVPDCVTGEKDAVDEDGNPEYQGIDTSFLVATLTAAIQEQQALITTLTARIEALEAKNA